jgi:hypothetical protein
MVLDFAGAVFAETADASASDFAWPKHTVAAKKITAMRINPAFV